MTHNLNSNIPNSYCYDDVDKNCQGYGRLYTWESAIEGCKLLGEGWRLPTNIEWQKLTIVYGGAAGDSAAIRRKSYFTLLFSDTAGFNALLGSGRDPDGHYSVGMRMDSIGQQLKMTLLLPRFAISRMAHKPFISNKREKKIGYFLFGA